MTKKEQFFKILFDEDDLVRVCQIKETRGRPYKRSECFYETGSFFSINPMKKESKTRKKEDVSKFRNFLIEFDDELSTEKQIEYINSIEMPYSTCVFSGHKSYHFIISLEQPLEDIEEYEHFSNYLHNIVTKADSQTRSASQMSRFPQALRKETGNAQEIQEIKDRIPNDIFISWLERHPNCMPEKRVPTKKGFSTQGREGVIEILNWYVQEYLSLDYSENSKWTYVQCPLCAEEGRDNHEDNMCITHERMTFSCFADSEHNKPLFFKMLELKNSHGESDARKAWKEHNRKKTLLNESAIKSSDVMNPSDDEKELTYEEEQRKIEEELMEIINN